MNEKKPNANELTDEELNEVQGGSTKYRQAGSKYYQYTGVGDADSNRKYLCPRCSRPVHLGFLGRYYCDPCDEGWSGVGDLKLNLSSGVWQEISEIDFLIGARG